MSHDPSRKSFLGKLIGLVAVATVAPRLLAKSALNRSDIPGTKTSSTPASFTLRSDSRAVARRADSV